MYPGFYFDRTMILLLPAVIIAFWAQKMGILARILQE